MEDYEKMWLEHPLRSPGLRPTVQPRFDDAGSWARAVEQVVGWRGEVGEGDLLCFKPFETLSDGAASVASVGYFDWDNTPPWDTWVECLMGPDGPVLLSRVPFAYRSLV